MIGGGQWVTVAVSVPILLECHAHGPSGCPSSFRDSLIGKDSERNRFQGQEKMSRSSTTRTNRCLIKYSIINRDRFYVSPKTVQLVVVLIGTHG